METTRSYSKPPNNMRSKYAKKVLAKTPESTRIFVRWYGDIVLRVQQILKEKEITQKELAERLDKKPSEISKWLNGQHNFTLQSLAKLQAELGEPLLYVPKTRRFKPVKGAKKEFTAHQYQPVSKPKEERFQSAKLRVSKTKKTYIANVG